MDFFAGIKDHAAIDRKDDDEKIKKRTGLSGSGSTGRHGTFTAGRICALAAGNVCGTGNR